jgi:hypothetical protein
MCGEKSLLLEEELGVLWEQKTSARQFTLHLWNLAIAQKSPTGAFVVTSSLLFLRQLFQIKVVSHNSQSYTTFILYCYIYSMKSSVSQAVDCHYYEINNLERA